MKSLTNRRLTFAPFALVVMALSASCLKGARAPDIAVSRTLDLAGASGAAKHAAKPFGVVFASPVGEQDSVSEATIVFNRPMRTLELAGEESTPPATLMGTGGMTPKGAWRWMGASALAFIPEKALPRATQYTVTIPAGTKSLSGETLAVAYTYTFSTPRPKLVRFSPSDGADHQKPDVAFELRFDQPITLKEVEAHAHLHSSPKLITPATKVKPAKLLAAGNDLAFRVSYPEKDVTTYVKLTPTNPLALAETFELVLDKDLHGVEGPLATGEVHELTLSTYAPQSIVEIDCTSRDDKKACEAGANFMLRAENAMSMREWQDHLKVDPQVVMKFNKEYDKETTTYFSLPFRPKAAAHYRVTMTAGAKDEFGQVLAKGLSKELATGDERPFLTIGLEGSVFEKKLPATSRVIPIGTTNVDSYEMQTSALSEEETCKLIHSEFAVRSGHGRGGDLPHAKSETVRPGAARNNLAVKRVGLDDILGGKPGTAALMLVSQTGDRGESRVESRIVRVTDLAITAKVSRFGSLFWVTRLSDGSFVPGATLSIRDEGGNVLATTTTDATGLAKLAPKEYLAVDAESGQLDSKATIIARVGDDWTYERVDEPLDSWRYGTSVELGGKLGSYGMLFTDRGIYKPGETIHVKGIFRQAQVRGIGTPKGRTVVLSATDALGTEIFTKESQLGPFGEVSRDVAIPEGAHLGEVWIRANVKRGSGGEEGAGFAYSTVIVDAYRPAEFKVAVEADKPSYIRGDNAEFTTRGDYLFGAPMSGGKARITVTRRRGSFMPPGLQGYVVDDSNTVADSSEGEMNSGRLQNQRTELSAKGQALTAIALALPNQRGAELVHVESDVEDLSRQTIASETSTIVHPGEFYIALKSPTEWMQSASVLARPEVLAVSPKGEHVAGVTVQLELVKRVWTTAFEESGDGYYGSSKPVDTSIGGCTVTTAMTSASCALKVPEGGYFYVRAKAEDKRKNPLVSSYGFYATSDNANVAWGETSRDLLDLVLDKNTYEIGQTARIMLKSPFREAEALVTVERAGVYSQFRTKVTGSMPMISVPVTADMNPNGFVAVQLWKGRSAAPPARGADVAGPAFRLGYANIVLNPEAKRLKVTVKPAKTDLKPGQELDVDLEVKDRQGKGVVADVTFYAVDEGVLMLTGYKTPDPLANLSQSQNLNVASFETRRSMARVLRMKPGPSDDKGGDGGDGGNGARTDFRSTAYFGSQKTDASGKTRVHFKLPDSLSTYRLMAVVAGEDDNFGFGENQVITSRELMARPALPRFLRAGDTMEAGVIVTAKGMGGGPVQVTATIEGAEIRGEKIKTVTLEKGGSSEVRFSYAMATVGKAKFSFKAEGSGFRDEVNVVRDVSPPMTLEAAALYGETASAAAEKLGSLANVRKDVGGLDLRVSSTALVGLDNGIEQLIEYPHGCTEQLTSRLVPLVTLTELAKAFNITLPKDTKKTAQDAIGKILEHQRGDGGFGYWADSNRSDPWVTAWAMWGLDNAKKRGNFVPDFALETAARYLRHFLEDKTAEDEVHLATMAFILDVLAVTDKADAGYMNSLFEKRSKLPLFARALLAHAYVAAKMSKTDIETMVKELEGSIRVTPTGAQIVDAEGDGYVTLLDSKARTTAMVLRALVSAVPDHPLGGRIARSLLSARKNGTWNSTQETAWALLALDDYRRAQEATPPSFDARVFFGETLAYESEFKGASVRAASQSFGMNKLLAAGTDSRMTFQALGTGTLFYEARLRYARTELPKDTLERGFFVRRYLRAVKPEDLADAIKVLPQTSATSINAGELALIDLFVITPDPREQVLVEDSLPAGLEAVNADLATAAGSLSMGEDSSKGDNDDERANGRARNSGSYHREFHDDRVLTFVEHMAAGAYHYRYLARATTVGVFQTPPMRASCMYEPETFGRTAGQVFEVRQGK